MRQYQMYIDGRFVPNGDRRLIPVINPATEEVVSEIPAGTEEDADEAVLAAEIAQKAWAKTPAIKRAGYLNEIACLIRKNADFLAHIVSEEEGKVLSQSTGEVQLTADYFDFMAGYARRIEGEIIQSDRPNEHLYLHKLPIGVVAGILPWNYPFFLIARKVAPALITGNAIVIKPSTETPNNAFEFAKLVDQCALPKGLFNLVTGAGSIVGNALAKNPRVGMVSLTGSVEAGARIMEAAAPNITKVSLELGGKAPAIVMPDADLDLAAKAIRDSRIVNTGQVCNCAERVYVHESVAEDFIEKVTAQMKATAWGNALTDGDADMGPLVSAAQLKSVDEALKKAVSEGARCTLGGRSPDVEKGYFYEPTVLVDCRHDMAIFHEETFGPVLPITTFRDFDEALEMANDCQYGLTSSIYTRDINIIMRACSELKFGETYVNRENGEAIQGFHAGWRKSGIGGADGKHGVEEYLQTHVVYIQYDDRKK